MFAFENKTILILSPQSWGKMHISKHHYAAELAKAGSKVYFLNPPCKNVRKNIEITELNKTLYSVKYKPFFPFKVRFHSRKTFDFLIKLQIKKILKKINTNFDVLWSFETNLFSDLSLFKAKLNIFHPVDMISGKYQQKIIKSSDVIFSVSDAILNKCKNYNVNKPMFFINHGLSEKYVNNIHKNITNTKNKANICYIGNLRIASLDTITFEKIIEENPNIIFSFFGAYKIDESNVGGSGSENNNKFITFLENKKNVVLKGPLSPSDIVKQLNDYNVFIVLLDISKDENKGSNSHKILEYLSTGKVIVSNYISTYSDKRNLIEMVDEIHNERLPALFKKVINNLEYYNKPELQQNRINFALDNTYEKQIKRIEKIISDKIMN